jgi:hypothetical protein
MINLFDLEEDPCQSIYGINDGSNQSESVHWDREEIKDCAMRLGCVIA